MSVNIFLWLHYINKCISFGRPVFWLGSVLIFDEKLVSACAGGYKKNILSCISKNKNVAKGCLFGSRKFLLQQNCIDFDINGLNIIIYHK